MYENTHFQDFPLLSLETLTGAASPCLSDIQSRAAKQLSPRLRKQCLESLQTQGLTLTSLQFILVDGTRNEWDVTSSCSGVSIGSDMNLHGFPSRGR